MRGCLRTASGVTQMPRSGKAAACATLALLLNYCEGRGCWPTAVQYILYYTLKKKSGGRRLIGRLPTFYRIYAKVRLTEVREWDRGHGRPYFYAGEARSALDATYDVA